MSTYLESGWFDPGERLTLRTAVVDGAMDVAGSLLRAEVPPSQLVRLALRVRRALRPGDGFSARQGKTLGPKARAALRHSLESLTLPSPALDAFVADCVEHVEQPRDLLGFYLHLVHVSRMMGLLAQALAKPKRRPRRASRPRVRKAPTKAKTPTKTKAKTQGRRQITTRRAKR